MAIFGHIMLHNNITDIISTLYLSEWFFFLFRGDPSTVQFNILSTMLAKKASLFSFFVIAMIYWNFFLLLFFAHSVSKLKLMVARLCKKKKKKTKRNIVKKSNWFWFLRSVAVVRKWKIWNLLLNLSPNILSPNFKYQEIKSNKI